MVENTKTKKTIIWLEDHPDYFPELQELINKLGFELIICHTLEEFREVTDKFKSKPDLIMGFIIDVALRGSNDNLSALKLAHIRTQQGGLTGMQVVIYFLLGLHKKGKNKNNGPFASIPVALVTVLEDSANIFRSLLSPSSYADDDQTRATMDKIKFIFKEDDSLLNGGDGNTSKIRQWLNGFK